MRRSYGAEISIDYTLGRLRIDGSYGYTHAEFRTYLGTITTIYKNGDIAILRINGGEGFVLDAFRTCGYNKMEIVSQISDYTDDVTPTSDEPLYFCIKICDDEPINLTGNSIREKLDNLLNDEYIVE